MNVRTYRRANCDSEHFLVCARFRARIMRGRTGRNTKAKKLCLEKLKIAESRSNYQLKLREVFETRNAVRCGTNEAAGSAVEEKWRSMKSAILDAGEAVLGPRPEREREMSGTTKNV